MRALVLQDWWKLAVEERPDPTVGPGDVLVRPIATGICGSDVHGYTGENGRRVLGQVMGHETVARVEAIGADVPSGSGLSVGDIVTINPVFGCQACSYCRSGNPQACATKSVLGVTPSYPSAFAELVAVPAANVVALPEGTPVEYGALVEPLSVGYHAARRGQVDASAAVLVIGGGPIGQACVLAALRLGASGVVVTEPNPNRHALCEALGASVLDPASEEDLPGAVAGILGQPPTVVLDAAGTTTSMRSALACAPLLSTVVLVGMGHPTLELPAYEVSTKERAIVGSFCYTPAEFADTARWVGTTTQDLQVLIEGRVNLAHADEAFRDLARGDGTVSKVLVMVQQ